MSAWDPIGVSHNPRAWDEYDGYLVGVVDRLRDADDPDDAARDVIAYLEHVDRDVIGMPHPVAEDRLEEITFALVAWYEWSFVRGGLAPREWREEDRSMARAATREQHEQGLARFVAREHRPRFLDSLEDEKLRRKLRAKLAHFAWLDARYATAVATREPAEMAQALAWGGAPETCFLVSEDDELDGSELPLEQALELVLHSFHGTLISCVPGKLALFSDEAPNKETLILRRDS